MLIEAMILFVGVLTFLAIIILGWGIHIYNYLQSGKTNVETQWSNIKTEYQRRWDLLPNLAEAVKSFKKHEEFTYPKVAEMRSMVNFKGSKAQTMKSMNFLDSFFSRLMVAHEQYPSLKAALHGDLMKEVRITEDRINVARTDYNDVVREYNIIIRSFPSSIIAHLMRFNAEQPYQAEAVADKAPKLDLN